MLDATTTVRCAGLAVERVVAAILVVVPGDFGVADLGRIGIDGRAVEVDADLPGRAAGRVGAGHGACGGGCPFGRRRRGASTSRWRWPPPRIGQEHDRICLPGLPIASFQGSAKQRAQTGAIAGRSYCDRPPYTRGR